MLKKLSYCSNADLGSRFDGIKTRSRQHWYRTDTRTSFSTKTASDRLPGNLEGMKTDVNVFLFMPMS